jgi:mono/diheme cytochrome c family protein
MRSAVVFCASLTVAAAVATAATPIPGDATRGGEVFHEQRCVACHSIQGDGGKSAPDLSRPGRIRYTPALMASLMWNHAPQMWARMQQASIEIPQLGEEQAADLFAFFYAFRYFEKPGDAGRGRAVFTRARCNECHESPGAAPPVTQWTTVNDPIDLARSMWNHAPQMREEFTKRKISWPRLTGQDLTDLVVYSINLPGARRQRPTFAPAAPDTGEQIFQMKGCTGCHQGNKAIAGRVTARTLADFGASMWNHAPDMIQLPPSITDAEMKRLVGYLWSIQYFDEPGNARRGERLFSSKGCASCHGEGGGAAPRLDASSNINAIRMVSALWQHGPRMQEQMRAKNIRWPRFTNTEMNDLLTFIDRRK